MNWLNPQQVVTGAREAYRGLSGGIDNLQLSERLASMVSQVPGAADLYKAYANSGFYLGGKEQGNKDAQNMVNSKIIHDNASRQTYGQQLPKNPTLIDYAKQTPGALNVKTGAIMRQNVPATAEFLSYLGDQGAQALTRVNQGIANAIPNSPAFGQLVSAGNKAITDISVGVRKNLGEKITGVSNAIQSMTTNKDYKLPQEVFNSLTPQAQEALSIDITRKQKKQEYLDWQKRNNIYSPEYDKQFKEWDKAQKDKFNALTKEHKIDLSYDIGEASKKVEKENQIKQAQELYQKTGDAVGAAEALKSAGYAQEATEFLTNLFSPDNFIGEVPKAIGGVGKGIAKSASKKIAEQEYENTVKGFKNVDLSGNVPYPTDNQGILNSITQNTPELADDSALRAQIGAATSPSISPTLSPNVPQPEVSQKLLTPVANTTQEEYTSLVKSQKDIAANLSKLKKSGGDLNQIRALEEQNKQLKAQVKGFESPKQPKGEASTIRENQLVPEQAPIEAPISKETLPVQSTKNVVADDLYKKITNDLADETPEVLTMKVAPPKIGAKGEYHAETPVTFRNRLEKLLFEIAMPRQTKMAEAIGMDWGTYSKAIEDMKESTYKPLAQLLFGKTNPASVNKVMDMANSLYGSVIKRIKSGEGQHINFHELKDSNTLFNLDDIYSSMKGNEESLGAKLLSSSAPEQVDKIKALVKEYKSTEGKELFKGLTDEEALLEVQDQIDSLIKSGRRPQGLVKKIFDTLNEDKPTNMTARISPVDENDAYGSSRYMTAGAPTEISKLADDIQKSADEIAAKRAGEVPNKTQRASSEIQTASPEFKSWFGKSKVINEKGEPLVVYHGTDSDFNIFDKSKQAEDEPGFFFAKAPKVASAYAEGRNIYKEVPRQDPAMQKLFGSGQEKVGETFGNIKPVYLNLENPLEIDFKGQEYTSKDIKKVIEDAKSKGHDGIIAKNLKDVGSSYLSDDGLKQTQYIAFEPNQIKSATGNSGKFDRANPDITKRATAEHQLIDLTQLTPEKPAKNGYDILAKFKQDYPLDEKILSQNVLAKLNDGEGIDAALIHGKGHTPFMASTEATKNSPEFASAMLHEGSHGMIRQLSEDNPAIRERFLKELKSNLNPKDQKTIYSLLDYVKDVESLDAKGNIVKPYRKLSDGQALDELLSFYQEGKLDPNIKHHVINKIQDEVGKSKHLGNDLDELIQDIYTKSELKDKEFFATNKRSPEEIKTMYPLEDAELPKDKVQRIEKVKSLLENKVLPDSKKKAERIKKMMEDGTMKFSAGAAIGAGAIGGTMSAAQASSNNKDTKPSNSYGKRHDGTEKGIGYFGELKRLDNPDDISTEIGITVDLPTKDGTFKETELPLIVPTLSKEELNYLLSKNGMDKTRDMKDKTIRAAIKKKAVEYAIERIKQGKSPFAEPGEIYDVPSK